MANLDNSQKELCCRIIDTPGNWFVTGAAGTGKTVILLELINRFLQIHNASAIQTVVPTGAATLLCNGKTIHSYFQINPFEKSPHVEKLVTASLARTSPMLKALKVLIIDEISMVSNKIFIAMHEILKRAKEVPEPFGGLKLIIFGDFKQLEPVNDGSEFVYNDKKFTLDYCFKTDVWTELNFHKHLLTKIYRQLNDDYFTSILDRLRTNCLTLEDCHTLIKRIPIIPIDTVPWPNDVVPLHMFGRLEDVDKVNRTEYAKLKGDECVSVPAIVWKRNGKDHVRSGCDAKLAKFEKEFLSNINVLAELKIKQNMQVIVRLNVYSANIYNGMRGRISRIDYDTADTPALLEITLADGTTREITKHMYTSNYDNEHTLCVSQFPVNMAWATTIHKAQGMTLDKIVLDLSMRSIWSAYQAYVGLSRTRKLSDVFLVNFVPATVMGCKEVEEMYANSAADCGGEADDDRENDVDGGKRRATLDDEINNRKRVKRAAAASDSSIYDYDSLYDERAQLVNPQSHGNLITSYLKDIDHSTRHLMLRLRDPNQRTGILMDDKSLLVFDKYDTNVLDGYKERSETITLYPTGAYPLVPPKPEDYCPLVHTLILLLQDVNENTIITFKKRPGVAGGDLFVEITKSSCVFLSGLFLKNYNTLLVDTKCTMKTFIKK